MHRGLCLACISIMFPFYLHPTYLPADVCQELGKPVFFQHLLWRRTGNSHKICFTETFTPPWEEGDGIPTLSAEGSGAEKSHVLVGARTRAWTWDFPILQHAASIKTCETSGCSQGIIFAKKQSKAHCSSRGLDTYFTTLSLSCCICEMGIWLALQRILVGVEKGQWNEIYKVLSTAWNIQPLDKGETSVSSPTWWLFISLHPFPFSTVCS